MGASLWGFESPLPHFCNPSGSSSKKRMQQKNVIEVLPASVIEKIAAGEVVERPASVLKELIENSIDAGATRIDIAVEDAGFALMKISDNGCGMSSADLVKSLLRHATSKIRSADDLFSIATMGFRGEALASIAAVSRLSIASSDNADGLGYEVCVEGGVQKPIAPVQHLRGTSIHVRDLFFNVPARKKFMKTQRGEQLAIVKMLEQIAIPFPGIHFTATIDGKKVFDLPAVNIVLDRIASVAGHDFARTLVECRNDSMGINALAFVSTPEKLQSRPRFQSLYVNLRRIDSDSVVYAVREAFSQFLGHNNRPNFFCFLDIDPHRVDVNVHPTKQQIKFDDERAIFGFVFHTVKSGLSASSIKSADLQAGTPPVEEKPIFEKDIQKETVDAPSLFTKLSSGEEAQTILNFPSMRQSDKELDTQKDGNIQLSKDDRDQPWELIPCYQIHGMFILAPIKNGILLIDQHAAHERVLYEQALQDLQAGQSPSQQLLFPIILEMTPTEKAILESGNEYFASFGFEISDFGGQSVSVSALPAFLKDGQVEETIRSMVRYLLEGRSPDAFNDPSKRFAAAFACGAAIKFGQKLSQEEMNALLNTLFSTANPYICPHGRPTLVRISVDELTRRFLR